ncbi:hypothetical protein [Streptomyces fumanus]|uniref:Uncharacterized protein n=1 Tax=Streptomyces fumanus TaxID=67302 RepID=A0A919AV54_9ACTN|nr:hypothetical protein [Streptomyces fumanus]GHF27756.1 hypothetical protein GCM10018772_61710 [Streptomyces fumanus]
MSEAIDAVRQMFQAFATGKIADAQEYIHPEYINPATLERSEKRGPENFTDSIDWLRNVLFRTSLRGNSLPRGRGVRHRTPGDERAAHR